MEKDSAGLEHAIVTDDNFSESTLSQNKPENPQIEEMNISQKKENNWALSAQVESFHRRNQQAGFKDRKLGVTWKNLQVEVLDAGSAIHENVLSQLNPCHFMRSFFSKPSKKTILMDSHGCVKPGEMLLVLGRPGSGCTTLLNILANKRAGYPAVTGDVFFGSMNHKEAEEYRSHIVMQEEEEVFFPTLKVGQTVNLATRLKVPSHRPGMTAAEYQKEQFDFLLDSMSISHTVDTKVGNEYVRGVSGGERKRVSIVEALTTQASVFCWDNSTRGLDASTALDWAKAIRTMTDVYGLSTIVTLYQPGNNIVGLFDKVLVLDEGQQIYYGPMNGARLFMENLGFYCTPGANVADFLTGVTVPNERRIRPGFESRFPRTADDILVAYQQSSGFSLDNDEYNTTEEAMRNTDDFRSSIALEKHKRLPSGSPHTVSFPDQVMVCTIRQYQVIWGDKHTLFIKHISSFVQALVAGSLFYNAPSDSSGLFMKAGGLFFSILYNCLVAMSEVTDSFTGRPVLIKHKGFALYHPAAFCIAQILADIPIILFQVSVFSIVLYFMVGLKATASAFFTYWVVVFATTICVTAMFRAVGAIFKTFDGASKVSGFLITAAVLYAGYMIERPKMHPWFAWIFWIDPLAYSFEALMGNEFHNQVIQCVGDNLIPSGTGYANSFFASCAGISGAVQGETSLTGDRYIAAMHYKYDHVWRNFGIIWAWWALFAGVTVVFTSRWRSPSEDGANLLIPRERLGPIKRTVDEEAQKPTAPADSKETVVDDQIDDQLISNSSVFTWKDLTYTVKTPSGDRVLLDNVYGWIKPGTLGALMGSSGAGKTTLLDVLAQRKTDGTIHGSILVDGRPLPVAFQRSAGYCEQLDVHESYSTVREALEFSAILRQPQSTPRQEKLRYVDTIIQLLELDDLANTLIGTVGKGLSIEQRKRVTIGVELVAKPSILIFLDEPTSGLDGQSAYNTVRFLRKLANVGQAILVTIHQPSAQLFAQFDTLLLLAKGGKTVYFGDIGEEAQTIKSYFSRNGRTCASDANPAEYMIDVTSGHLSQGKDWNQIWLESPEHKNAVSMLDRIIEEAASKPSASDVDDDSEFAVSLWEQIKVVSHRMNMALFRNTSYINNKLILHVVLSLFNGFSFWQIGNAVAGLQLRLFTVFSFLWVAPGVINQLQPLFISRRDLYDAREKKSRMYSWISFTVALIVSEVPYLCICGVLYFACWYYTVGFPSDSTKSGATFFVMLCYEFIYTGLGQMIAAFAPNAVYASLINPLILGILVEFCGALVPYAQIQAFWRYWIYYLNPFNYVMGSILTFTTFDAQIQCAESEYALFDPPQGQTCEDYLSSYLKRTTASLVNPTATSACRVCQFQRGSDYLRTMNLNDYYYGWRDAGIVVVFLVASYAFVFLMMKLKTKASKKAE